jgi:hypothetical protein
LTLRRPTAGAAALAALVTGAATFIAVYGLRDHLYLADEGQGVSGARYLEGHFPSGLWDTTVFPRGPERLTAVLEWLVNLVAPSTPAAFAGYHVVLALVFALSAVPVWALARELGLAPLPALVPAALVVVGPWALYGTTLLNGGAGLLAAAWLYLAMWRAVTRPGLRNDAWLLAAVALLALARVGNVPLLAAFPVAVLVQVWRDRPAGQAPPEWLRGLPRVGVRRHPLLFGVAVLGAAVVAVRGFDVLLGGSAYGGVRKGQGVSLAGLRNELRLVVPRLAQATALVPLALALPWLVRQALRPRDRGDGAFAVLALGATVAFLYAYYLSYDEDRYWLPLLPLVAIAFARVVWAGGVGWPAALLGAVVVGRLVAVSPVVGDFQGRTYFYAPGELFFDRVVSGQLSVHLPVGGHHTALVATAAAGLAALALVLRGRLGGRAPVVVLGVVLVGLAAYQVGAANWAMQKYSVQATGAGQSFAQQAFVDEVVRGPDRSVPLLANNPTGDPLLGVAFEQLAFFNRRVDRDGRVQLVGVGASPCCVPGARIVRIDPVTGRGHAEGGPPPERYVVRTGFRDVALVTDVVATTPSFPLQLEHPRVPLQAAYVVRGTVQGGWGRPGRPTRIRVYAWPGRPAAACLTGRVVAPSAGATGVDWSVDGARGRSVAGTLAPGAEQTLRVRLPKRTATLSLGSSTGMLPGGTRAGVTLQDARVGACR